MLVMEILVGLWFAVRKIQRQMKTYGFCGEQYHGVLVVQGEAYMEYMPVLQSWGHGLTQLYSKTLCNNIALDIFDYMHRIFYALFTETFE